MKWIRLWSEDLWSGTTIQELNAEQFRLWTLLLVVAGLRDYQGMIPKELLVDIGLRTRRRHDRFLSDLSRLQEVGKVVINDDGSVKIKNWSKYQTRYEKYYKGKK